MAASSRAATFLSQSEITLSVVTAKVDPERCASCLICVRACPYGVPRINKEGVSESTTLCAGAAAFARPSARPKPLNSAGTRMTRS